MKNSDYLCELLTPIEPSQALGYLNDPRYLMQVKEDGVRLVVERYAGVLVGFDRYGVITAVPKHLHEALAAFGELAGDYVIDGELIGYGNESIYVVWDLLRFEDEDLKRMPYGQRFDLLRSTLLDLGFPLLHKLMTVQTWYCGEDSGVTAGMLSLYEAGVEGVCFKDTLAAFQPGRAKQHFKLKFWESATCRVADKSTRADARMDKHSIAIELLDGDIWRSMGFVTIHNSQPLPPVGSIVEIRYLYAQREGLYQGNCLGIRHDARNSDCTLEQLKWQQAPCLDRLTQLF